MGICAVDLDGFYEPQTKSKKLVPNQGCDVVVPSMRQKKQSAAMPAKAAEYRATLVSLWKPCRNGLGGSISIHMLSSLHWHEKRE